MHPEEKLFLEVLHHKNWPIGLRLIYADWLDENGMPEHALDIRRTILHRLIMMHYNVPLLPTRPAR